MWGGLSNGQSFMLFKHAISFVKYIMGLAKIWTAAFPFEKTERKGNRKIIIPSFCLDSAFLHWPHVITEMTRLSKIAMWLLLFIIVSQHDNVIFKRVRLLQLGVLVHSFCLRYFLSTSSSALYVNCCNNEEGTSPASGSHVSCSLLWWAYHRPDVVAVMKPTGGASQTSVCSPISPEGSEEIRRKLPERKSLCSACTAESLPSCGKRKGPCFRFFPTVAGEDV